MQISSELKCNMCQELARFVIESRHVSGYMSPDKSEYNYQILRKQLKAEQMRARRNSPFYSLRRHTQLLSRLAAIGSVSGI